MGKRIGYVDAMRGLAMLLVVVGEWFRANPNPVIEYVLAMAVAAVVIAASLLVGRIIRLSPTLAHWLLAAKK